jgi:polyisoprenoid-binding protein YceI
MSRPSSLAATLLVVLAGCAPDEPAQPPAESTAPAAASSAPVAAPVEGVVYNVDADASEVFWRISKAGVMARFGHNHVISARQFDGRVVVDPNDAARSRFELEIPVAALVIDEPELRARFGEEFASVPSEADKEGTRTNMLGDGLLQAATYPVVRVRGGELAGTGTDQTVAIEIEILGKPFDFRVPAAVALDDGVLEASGEFALDHADLGLTPFSALGGALQVGPRIEFTYRIRATATTGDTQ